MYLATLETSHYTFHAFGVDLHDAQRIMREAWETHRKQAHSAVPWPEVAGDVVYFQADVGQAYRDCMPIGIQPAPRAVLPILDTCQGCGGGVDRGDICGHCCHPNLAVCEDCGGPLREHDFDCTTGGQP